MANLTNIIGGQPYAEAVTSAVPITANKLLDFWKGTQAQYDDAPLKRTGGVLAGAPTAATCLAFTSLTTAAGMGWEIGDIVYVTGTTGSNTTRTVAEVTAVPLATSLTVSIAAYTSTATTGFQIDKYDPETLYLITA